METRTQNPLVIIGLDGCSWNILKPWMDEGKLPNLKTVVSNGVSADLISTIPPITGVALPSFFTGMNPGNTGIFSFVNPDGSLLNYRNIKHPAIWDYLGSVGIKSCVVGLRLTYPPKKINGIMLSGGLLRTEREDFIEPPELISIARDYHPREETYPVLYKTLKSGNAENPEMLAKELIELTKIQFSIFSSLRGNDRFPFSVLWIENTDLLQHFCWHRKDLILNLYETIDSLIGDFFTKIAYANFLIMSDHGFESVPSYHFYINSWLSSIGLFEPDRNLPHLAARWLKFFVRNQIIERFLSPYAKRKVSGYLKKMRFSRKKTKSNTVCDPDDFQDDTFVTTVSRRLGFNQFKTSAFSKDGWGIYINKGAVDDYGMFRANLMERLRNLKDASGRKVIRAVWKKEDVFKGVYLKQIPDIIFLTDGDFKASMYFSRNWIGPCENKQHLTGSHDSAYRGVFLAAGNDISKVEIRDFNMTDFLPTILAYYNIEVPDCIDGKSRAEIFKEYLDGVGHTSLKCDAVLKDVERSEGSLFTVKEEEEIKERLKNLGYLE